MWLAPSLGQEICEIGLEYFGTSDNTEAIESYWVVYKDLRDNLEKFPQDKHRAIQTSNQDHN